MRKKVSTENYFKQDSLIVEKSLVHPLKLGKSSDTPADPSPLRAFFGSSAPVSLDGKILKAATGQANSAPTPEPVASKFTSKSLKEFALWLKAEVPLDDVSDEEVKEAAERIWGDNQYWTTYGSSASIKDLQEKLMYVAPTGLQADALKEIVKTKAGFDQKGKSAEEMAKLFQKSESDPKKLVKRGKREVPGEGKAGAAQNADQNKTPFEKVTPIPDAEPLSGVIMRTEKIRDALRWTKVFFIEKTLAPSGEEIQVLAYCSKDDVPLFYEEIAGLLPSGSSSPSVLSTAGFAAAPVALVPPSKFERFAGWHMSPDSLAYGETWAPSYTQKLYSLRPNIVMWVVKEIDGDGE